MEGTESEYNRLEEQWDAMTTCIWEPWEPPRDVDIYVTDCDVITSFLNKLYRFCPYCGRKLKVVRRTR